MRDTLNDPKYNGVDAITELDVIMCKVDDSHISKKKLIKELENLICKLKGEEVKKIRPHRKPKIGVFIHRIK